jgi:hypothetical protein
MSELSYEILPRHSKASGGPRVVVDFDAAPQERAAAQDE